MQTETQKRKNGGGGTDSNDRREKYTNQEIHLFYLTGLKPLESKNLAKWGVSKKVYITEKEQGDALSRAKELGETVSS